MISNMTMLGNKYSGLILGLFLTTTSAALMANNESLIDLAKQYVSNLDNDCVYSDGYQCIDSTNTDYTDIVDQRGLIAAAVLQVWPTAYQQFLEENRLSDEQKKLKHYRVGFRLNDNKIEVLFRPLFLPLIKDGEAVGRIRATIGKEVKISISQKSNEVVGVIYGK